MEDCCQPRRRDRPGGDALYGLGVLGAALHFIQTATGFWGGVLGLLKAVFWPAIVVRHLLRTWGL